MHLSMQETWVRSLVWEDPACHGVAKPMCRGCCSLHTPEPVFHKRRPRTSTRVAPALHLDIRRLTIQSPWPFKSSDAIVKQSRVSAGYFSGLRAWGRIGKDSTHLYLLIRIYRSRPLAFILQTLLGASVPGAV